MWLLFGGGTPSLGFSSRVGKQGAKLVVRTSSLLQEHQKHFPVSVRKGTEASEKAEALPSLIKTHLSVSPTINSKSTCKAFPPTAQSSFLWGFVEVTGEARAPKQAVIAFFLTSSASGKIYDNSLYRFYKECGPKPNSL